tara:strand:- start:2698 stop:3312 length:615 start_codon:yes stop_codon:yes gene_type:complete
MAGAGTNLFVSGAVLTAEQVNNYLMDQSVMRFADTSARDAAFGGGGEPVLAEGMFAYTDDTNTLWAYDGSAWAEAVNTASLVDGAVTTGKLADKSVTSAKLSALTVGSTGAGYTFVLSDAETVVSSNAATAVTFTIPLNASVPFPTGTQLNILQYGAGQVTVAIAGGGAVVSEGSKFKLKARYAIATAIKTEVDTWVLVGNLSA